MAKSMNELARKSPLISYDGHLAGVSEMLHSRAKIGKKHNNA